MDEAVKEIPRTKLVLVAQPGTYGHVDECVEE